MGQGKSTCSFEARESESQNKRKRSSTSLPIGEGQRRVRGRPDSPRARPTLLQPSALDFRSKTLCSDASHSREAHVPSALPMAASSNTKRNYHVFLSFRGTDIRRGFLSHLYAALDQRGIYTFVDSEELRKGEEISPTLMRAIEESRIAIIVFSENYASSPWCLEELLKIMECKEQNGLKVFPVFYKVEPREVRGGRESYGRAMAKHESKLGKNSEKVKRWKKALLDAGNLSGWDFNDRDERDEAELIQSIVKELSIRLRRRSFSVAKYPVGIESRVQKLIRLSELAGNDVLMIGLWGPGGIGKTTIAKALCNAIGWQFQGCSFLAQVREKSNQSGGHVDLQRQLLSEILHEKKLKVYSVHGGISLIRERLCRKKVLLVLDDVDKMDQLDALAGTGDWFGKGSRIIITSRDKHLLTSHDKNYVYEVKTLKDDKARDLFDQHAFTNSNKVEIRRDLIDGALHYAGRLPLALEVLGSFLRGRKESAWESTLHKLSKTPESTINRVLKISFDGLDDNEREIFLDIACFFKGKNIEYIKEVLDSCDFDTTIGIEILIERSLIKNQHGTLQMHDLIQSMGQDIVNEACRDDCGKRSRLWLLEDVQEIFCYNTGTNAVKAIVLNWPPPEAVVIHPDAFTNMNKLRILILHGVHISSQAQLRLPNELRWLEWPNAPNLEFGSGSNKLVRLDVRKCPIRQFGGNFQKFRKLKSIDFSKCKSLVSICDLSSAPNMEKLILDGCESLVEVHPSVGNLVKLEVLSLRSCSNLSSFPNTLRTKSLQILCLSGCSKLKLEKFPDIDGKMEHLEILSLDRTAIKELPASIQNLVSVELMDLGGNFQKFRKLKSIDFSECKSLVSICDLSSSPNMEKLILDGCESLVEVHPSVGNLVKLEVLSLRSCSNLSSFPNTLRTKSLQILCLSGCSKLEKFPDIDGKMEHLEILSLDRTAIKELPASIQNLVSVELMDLGGNFQKFGKLMSIDFSECKSLVSICDLSSAPNMKKFFLDGCESLVDVHPSVGNLVKLEVLSLRLCSNLSSFPNMLRTRSLEILCLSGCSKLEKFPDIDGKMKYLGSLFLDRMAIKELPASIQNLVSVRLMDLAFCKNLVRLPSCIYKLKSLMHLELAGCSNLITFPKNMEDSTDLYLGFQKLSFLTLKGCNLSELDFLESSSSFANLQFLDLSYNMFTHLPTCINKYHQLAVLNLKRCKLLQEIPQLPSNCKKLSAPHCKSLQKVSGFGVPHYGGHLSVDLSSCCELFRKGVNMDDVLNLSLPEGLPKEGSVDIILSEREMPRWIFPCEEDSIIFMVPQDLYDKVKGLVLCFVPSPEEGKVFNGFCDVNVFVNGQPAVHDSKKFSSMEYDHMWLYYCPHTSLFGANKLLENDWIHFKVCFEAREGSIKKCGFCLICDQEGADLRMVFPAPSAVRKKAKVFWEDSEEDNSTRGRNSS